MHNIEDFNPILLQYGIKTRYLWNNEEEKKLVLEYVYNFVSNFYRNRFKLNKLGDKLITLYLNSHTNTSIQKIVEPLENKSIFNPNNILRDLILQYFCQFEIGTSLLCEYDIITKRIGRTVPKNSRKIRNANPVLAKYGIKCQLLWRNDLEKRVVLEYIYNYCKECNFEFDKMRELAKSFDFNKNYKTEIINGSPINIYEDDFWIMLELCHRYEVEVLKNKDAFSILSEDTILFDLLFKAMTIEDVVKVLNSKTNLKVNGKVQCTTYYKYQYLKSKFIKVINNYGSERMREYYSNLSGKFDMYKQYYDHQIEEDKKRADLGIFKEAENIIEEFISCDTKNAQLFCKQHNISRNEFRNYVNILKDKNPTLFLEYSNIASLNKKQAYALAISKLEQIGWLIANRVEENSNQKRDFDLIDFYQIAGNLSLEDILNLLKSGVNTPNLIGLKKFIASNKKYMKPDKNARENILSMNQYVNFEKDQNGCLIPGTGEIFDNDKKLQLMKYLEESNVPLNIATYNIAFNRYRKGYLALSKVKVKIKK